MLDGHPPGDGEKSAERLAGVLAAFAFYIVIFFLLHRYLGSSVAALSVLPVLVGGWMLGTRAGMATAVLTLFLNTLLLNLAGEMGWTAVLRAGGAPGSLAIVLAGAGVGWASSLYRRHTEEMVARQQAEVALRQSESHFRTLFEESPLGMSLVDTENRFVRVNPRLCEMLGYPAEALKTLTFVEITHPADVQVDLAQTAQLLAGEIPRFEMEKRYIRQDGSVVWVHLTVTTIRVEREGERYFLGMVEEIDERKKAEAQVYRRNRELQLLNRVVVAATSKLEPAVVLETTCRELAQAFNLPQAGVAVLENSGEALEVVAEYVTGAGVSAIGERIPLAGNVATEIVMREKRPLVIDDAQRDPQMAAVHELMRRRNVASMLLLPLQVNGDVVGTVGLDAAMPHAFSEEEVRLAATATAAAAQVLEKAELLQRTRRQAAQLAALRDVQLAISNSLEPQRVYQAIVEHAARLLVCPAVCLFQWDARAGVYRRLAAYGEPTGTPEEIRRLQETLAPERLDGLGAFVIPGGSGSGGNHTSLLAPLRYRNRVTGFLAFRQTRGRYGWSEEEIGTAESLTAQAAIAVANAQLHAQTRADAETVQQILNTMPDGVILLDAAHQIIMANPPARFYLQRLAGNGGPPLCELGGKPLSTLLAPPPQGHSGHMLQPDGGGAHVFEVRAAAVAPEGWILVIRDVTREREQQQQLQAQERLAAVGQLSAGIAHDFNNILAVIVLYTQMLQREVLPPKAGQRVDTIYKQAGHASRLVEQILDFGRKAVMKRQAFDLLPFLREQVELLGRTLPETIAVELEHEPGVYPVDADATRLQQTVMNLALNARDALPRGGRLRFSLARLAPEAVPPLAQMPAGDWIRLAVSDDGVGIAPEHLPHIFEPFYTTKGPGAGSGLGLAQVYGIVRQHDGYIDVDSSLGGGTTFTLFLPALPVESSAKTAGESAAEAETEQAVLVVEDNSIIREALAEVLQDLGYQVLVAENGEEAVALYDAQATGIGLVVSDMVMPRMGGQALFQALRARNPAIRMVIISGYPLDEQNRQFVEKSGSVWVRKPFTQEVLANAIRRTLDVDPNGRSVAQPPFRAEAFHQTSTRTLDIV